jgi:hypothetical protein
MRGLEYLVKGHDTDGTRHSSSSSIIADPELKQATETSTLTVSSTFIYILLIMALAEQEGLMDYLFVELNEPRISVTLGFFATEQNKKIAKLAMEQETWTQKFCVVAGLWGQPDRNDDKEKRRVNLDDDDLRTMGLSEDLVIEMEKILREMRLEV